MRFNLIPALLRSSVGALALSILPIAAMAQTQTWIHPGVLVSAQQLDAATASYNTGSGTVYSQVQKAMNSTYGSTSYTVQGPWSGGVEQCGSNSNPNNGCLESDNDSNAAYVQALLWYITGNQSYANNAMNIMNTYASQFKGFAGYTPGHSCPSGTDCSNGPLQAGWDSEKWPRAAEIIRYGHGGSAGWSTTNFNAFKTMMTNIYLPIIQNGSGVNGNWDMSMIEGIMGIAVLTESTSLLSTARSFWLGRVPDLFYYQPQDGNAHASSPRGTPSWFGQSIFNSSTSLVSQETCRDLRHAEDSLAGTINTAETDWIQGGSLYTNTTIDAEARIVGAMNQLAGFESQGNHSTTNPPPITAPASYCTSSGATNIGEITPGVGTTYAIGYNAYRNRLNVATMADGSGSSGLNGTANTYNWIQNGLLTQTLNNDYGNHMTLFEALTHTAEVCNNVGATWTNAGYISQTGSPTVKFNATPSANGINAVVGLTNGPQSAYANLAAIVRFNPSGFIDAYNGTGYSAASNIPYSGGTTYSFWIELNIPAQTYSVYVTPHDGTQVLVGSNYAFRLSATTLNNVTMYSQVGSDTVCSFNLPLGGNQP